MILVTYVCMYVCMYVRMYVCICMYAFYATRIDPPKGGSMILVTKTSDQTCMYVCMYMHGHHI